MSLQTVNRFKEKFDQDLGHIERYLENEESTKRSTTKVQRDVLKWITNHFDFNRSYVVTLHLNDQLSYKKVIRDLVFNDISKITTRLFRRLENRVFSKNSNKRLEKFTVIEGLKRRDQRNHIHFIVSTTQHMSREMMLVEIVRSFERTKYLTDVHIKMIDHNVSNLVDYLTKELKMMTFNDDTIDWKNTYMKDEYFLNRLIH